MNVMSYGLVGMLCIGLLTGCAQEFEEPEGKTDPMSLVSATDIDPSISNDDFFRDSTWTVFTGNTCLGCHLEGGPASKEGSRLVLDVSDIADNQSVVDTFIDETYDLLVHTPTEYGVDHPQGGNLLATDSDEAKILAETVLRFYTEE